MIVGVHTPEYPQETKRSNVSKAVGDLDIKWAVGMDNDYAAWKRYRNEAWPTFYLVDPDGQVVYIHVGEGAYDRTESRIRQLLDSPSK